MNETWKILKTVHRSQYIIDKAGLRGLCVEDTEKGKWKQHLRLWAYGPWCGKWDLNPYALQHKNLNLARLPIPSFPQMAGVIGFEPMLPASKAGALTAWRYPYMVVCMGIEPMLPPWRDGVLTTWLTDHGGPSGTWTQGHPVMSRELLPTELRDHRAIN